MTAEELAEIIDAREQVMGTMLLTDRIHAGMHELSREDAMRYSNAAITEAWSAAKEIAKATDSMSQTTVRALYFSFLIGLEVGRELERRV